MGLDQSAFVSPEGAGFRLPVDGSPIRQRSDEVRWFRRGKLPDSMLEWFGARAADVEVREDVYLVATQLPNLSVKIRGGEQLDVKVFRGTLGDERVPGRARGWIDCWEKWTFPFDSAVANPPSKPGWIVVGKERRLRSFVLVDGVAVPADRGGGDPECAVELTAVTLGGKPWWTLGFEATGSAEGRRAVLDAASLVMFEHALPDGLRLQLTSSCSYAALLRKLPMGKRHLRGRGGGRRQGGGTLRPLSDASI